MEDTERKRPTFVSAVSSTTLLSNLFFSLLLASACLMPAVVGCDQKTTIRPIELTAANVDDLDDLLFIFLMIWPYAFGASVAVSLVTVAIVRPQQLGKWLLPVPLTFQLALTVLGCIAIYEADDRQSLAFSTAIFFLPPAGLLCFTGIAVRRRGAFAGAMRGLSGLAILSSMEIYLNTMMMFASRILYGVYVSLIATGGMLFSSWLLSTRGEQLLSDRNAPLRPTQFGIRALFIWTSIVAIFIAGFQVLLLEDDTEDTTSGSITIEEVVP